MVDHIGQKHWRIVCHLTACCRWSQAQRQLVETEKGRGEWKSQNDSDAFSLLHSIYTLASVSDSGLVNSTSHAMTIGKNELVLKLYRISIAVIYLIASTTNLLANDPILWFVLMLMPTGPPATKLTALADVSGADESEKLSIAKFVTISCTCGSTLR